MKARPCADICVPINLLWLLEQTNLTRHASYKYSPCRLGKMYNSCLAVIHKYICDTRMRVRLTPQSLLNLKLCCVLPNLTRNTQINSTNKLTDWQHLVDDERTLEATFAGAISHQIGLDLFQIGQGCATGTTGRRQRETVTNETQLKHKLCPGSEPNTSQCKMSEKCNYA